MLVDLDSELVDPTMYMKLIGSLMYLANIRPNICFVLNTLSQFMVESKQVHWVATKHVLMYVCGIVGFGLKYVRGGGVRLHGYSDTDWAGSAIEKKSTSSVFFGLGSTIVSWYNSKQTCVALSSAEAKYMAASLESCEAIWICKLLVGLFGQELESTVIHCNNQSCIKISENPVFHYRSNTLRSNTTLSKCEGKLILQITKKIRKPNLNKSLEISSSHKSTTEQMYGLLTSACMDMLLYERTRLSLLELMYICYWFHCNSRMYVIVPTGTRVHAQKTCTNTSV
jgi:hypothetical protein